jgi:hypothetical protein
MMKATPIIAPATLSLQAIAKADAPLPRERSARYFDR